MHEEPQKEAQKEKTVLLNTPPRPCRQMEDGKNKKKTLVAASDGVLLDLCRLAGASPPLTLRVVSY